MSSWCPSCALQLSLVGSGIPQRFLQLTTGQLFPFSRRTFRWCLPPDASVISKLFNYATNHFCNDVSPSMPQPLSLLTLPLCICPPRFALRSNNSFVFCGVGVHSQPTSLPHSSTPETLHPTTSLLNYPMLADPSFFSAELRPLLSNLMRASKKMSPLGHQPCNPSLTFRMVRAARPTAQSSPRIKILLFVMPPLMCELPLCNCD